MKKIYLLVLILCTCSASFASYTFNVFQTNWRWRNNNGSETAATWKAAQDSAISINGKGVIRLRIEIVNTSTTTQPDQLGNYHTMPYPISMTDSLQYSTNPTNAKSWINIGVDKWKAFIIQGAGGRIVQDQAHHRTTYRHSLSLFRGENNGNRQCDKKHHYPRQQPQ